MVRSAGSKEDNELGYKRYPCPLDDSVQVVEFPFGEEAETHAMIVMTAGSGVILLNASLPDEYNTDIHRMAIFAHELGHLAMGEDESEADDWAIDKLKLLGLDESAQLLINRCENEVTV
tara:strand:- start:2434 stop:2790 length:357 start_codon:yes stop_codon:yes gene_type:complete